MEPFRRRMWIIVFMGSVVGLLGTSCHLNRLPDVHFEATPQNVVEEMLEMAKVTKEDMVYDLGCGDGRFVITAAKKFGAQGVGIDIDPKRVKESRENIIEAGVTDRVKIIEDDLFKTNISEATVITLYLLQDLNLKLRPKLLRELQPGSRVVSYVFHMGDWKPDIMKPLKNSTSYYYIWVIPADVAGIWRWNGMTQKGDQPYTLRLKQNFQEVSGHVTIQEGRRIRIIGAQLIGDRLNFVLKYDEANKQKVAMQFNGRVSGNTLHGNMEMIGGPLAGNYPWTARRNP